MKRIITGIISIPALLFLLFNFKVETSQEQVIEAPEEKIEKEYSISGVVRANDTLELIFDKHNLDKSDMRRIYNESRKQYNLSNISVGSTYTFEIDREQNTIQSMQYGIDDLSFLDVKRNSEGFSSEVVSLPVERKAGSFSVDIRDNLASSMPGTHNEYSKLSLKLSDIYAWDIDLSNDIRNGDSVKIIVEELWVGSVFMGYGDILAAEFLNSGERHYAFRFAHDGYSDYYDEKGVSLRKALLRSPLKFKYISSGFSRNRLHPLLRVYRPHLGIDYAAPGGTPVSAAGDGKVLYAGHKGQMGKMVRISHPGGYETYYGHLSRIPGKIKKGARVSQGDIIGYVGKTGLASGPHLDYRIKLRGKFVNPLKILLPRGDSVPAHMMAEYSKLVDSLAGRIDSISGPVMAQKEKKKHSG